MKRVALLGSGYIGKSLIAPLKERGCIVRVSTTSPTRVPELERVADEVFVLPDKFQTFLQDCDCLIVTVAPKQGADYESTYLDTAKTVQKLSPSLKQLIYTSSTSVYGNYNGEWVDEESEPLPETPQAKILLQTESVYLNSFSSLMPVCVLRLGGIYGPGREIENRVKKFSGKHLPGSGSSYTNLVHRDDVVLAILWAMEHSLSGIYNVVEDTHVSRRDLYNTLARRQNLPEVFWDESQPSTHAGNKRVSSEKLQKTGFILNRPQESVFGKEKISENHRT